MAGKAVLVLDDAEEILNLIKLVIEHRCHWSVITARNLSEIIANQDQVLLCRVAILDINLGPDEPSGIEAYQWLRENGFGGSIYFLTGHATTHPLVSSARKLGDAHILTKPLTANQLTRIVQFDHYESSD